MAIARHWRDLPTCFSMVTHPMEPMKLDIISDGDHVKYYVNSVLANEAFDVKPSSGKISLQVEGAEMDFRNFELHPLDN